MPGAYPVLLEDALVAISAMFRRYYAYRQSLLPRRNRIAMLRHDGAAAACPYHGVTWHAAALTRASQHFIGDR